MPHQQSVTGGEALQEITGAVNTFSDQQTKDEAPDDQRSLAKKWQDRINDARLSMGDLASNIDKYRMYVRGEQHDDKKKGLIRANLIHAHIKKSVNQTYARNPQFSIRPTEQVSSVAIRKMRLFGKTAEIVLNRVFEDSKLKRRAKACLRAAKTTGIGWAKVFYSTNIKTDPIMQSRTKDLQDRLQQLDKLKRELSDPEEIANKERLKLEIQQTQKSLNMESEQVIYEGLVIDILDSKNLILDVTTIKDFDDYNKAPFMVEEIMMTKSMLLKRWNQFPAGTKEFKVGKSTDDSSSDNLDNNVVVKVYEIWDAENRLVHYMTEGGEAFLQDPIQIEITGEDWYPYLPMGVNIVDGQFFPLSDTALLMDLQDEHNSARTRFQQHRDIAIPHWVGKKDALDETDAKTIMQSVTGEIALVNGEPGQPIKNYLDIFSSPPVDPAIYDTTHTERDMERVAGGGEVSQPKSNRSRTLGEAQLLSEETGTQITADTDEVEDWFGRLAKHTLEILLQALTVDQVVEIAGPLAEPEIDQETGEPTGKLLEGVVWPEMEIDNIFNMLQIQIQAGSSGRPNKDKEMQVWTQLLMPKVTDLVMSVGQLRENGQEDLAESLMMIAQETLRRLDERFDIHEFLPTGQSKPAPEPPPDPAVQQKMAELEQSAQKDAATLRLKEAEMAQRKELESAKLITEAKKVDAEIQNMKDKILLEEEQLQTEREKVGLESTKVQFEFEKSTADRDDKGKDRESKEAVEMAKLNDVRDQREFNLAPKVKEVEGIITQQADTMAAIAKAVAENSKVLGQMVERLTAPKKLVFNKDGRPIGVETVDKLNKNDKES